MRKQGLDERSLWDLESFSEAKGLASWMSRQWAPVEGLRVVEVGAGIGTFTAHLIAGGAEEVIALEPDPACLDVLRERFDEAGRVELVGEEVPGCQMLEEASVDLVICQNVLEHVEDDRLAFEEMVSALVPGGRIFLLVPALPRLFGSLDAQYGHLRRYQPADLRELAAENKLEDLSIRYFNALGIIGWWVKCRIRATGIGSASLRVYETFLKAWRPVEDRVRIPVGLSLILEARKPAAVSESAR